MNYYWEQDEVLGKLDVKMTAAFHAVSELARAAEALHARCGLRHRHQPRGAGVPRPRLGLTPVARRPAGFDRAGSSTRTAIHAHRRRRARREGERPRLRAARDPGSARSSAIFRGIAVAIPRLTVIGTGVFDAVPERERAVRRRALRRARRTDRARVPARPAARSSVVGDLRGARRASAHARSPFARRACSRTRCAGLSPASTRRR